MEGITPGQISHMKANKSREIERIREEYAASRKKVIDDFTSEGHTGHHRTGSEMTMKTDLHDKYSKYVAYTPSSLLKLTKISEPFDAKKDYLSDSYRKITTDYKRENPEIESKYSHAL